MANLLIKPTTGSGNKLIIQDQDGGDIITSADSGATIENVTFPTITTDTIKLTPGSAPSTPVEGQLYFNNANKILFVYNGSSWQNLTIPAIGGIVTTYSGYISHTFLTSDIFTPLVPLTVDYLVVAGGGGASSNYTSGAGGAGGLLISTGVAVTAQNYTVTVGGGGAGHQSGSPGVNGSGSTFLTTVTAGGGGGAGGWGGWVRFRD